jgi:hypothetical protein
MVQRVRARDRTWVSFTSGSGTRVFHESGTSDDAVWGPDADAVGDGARFTHEFALPVGPYFLNVLQVTALVYLTSISFGEDEGNVAISGTQWELIEWDPPGGDQVVLHFSVGISGPFAVRGVGYHITVEAEGIFQDVEQRSGETFGLIDGLH